MLHLLHKPNAYGSHDYGIPEFQPRQHQAKNKDARSSPLLRLRKSLHTWEHKLRSSGIAIQPEMIQLPPALQKTLEQQIATGSELKIPVNANTVRSLAWIRRIQAAMRREQKSRRTANIKEAIERRNKSFSTNRGLGDTIDRILNRKAIKQPIIGVIYETNHQVGASTAPPNAPSDGTGPNTARTLSFKPSDVEEHTTRVFEQWAGKLETIPKAPKIYDLTTSRRSC